MPKLFLLYDGQNKSFAAAIVQFLNKNGFDQITEVSFDEDNLSQENDRIKEIETAALNNEVFLIFIAEQGIGLWQNERINKLIDAFVYSEERCNIIPLVILHETSDLTKKNLPRFIADYQWIEFSDANDKFALEKLLNSFQIKEEVTSISNKNPYKGLEHFEVEDAPYFSGRNLDLNWIFYKKLKINSGNFSGNFLAVIGDSGCGKSSFARAGILAALKNGNFKEYENGIQIIIKPGGNPLFNLSISLEKNGIIKESSEFRKEAMYDKVLLFKKIQEQDKKLVILADQFEELITRCNDENERRAFLDNLMEALKSGKLLILITLRSDYYSSFTNYHEFAEKMENNNYALSGLEFSEDNESWNKQINGIIQIPAKLHGVKVDKALEDIITENLKNTYGVLPVLELTMTILWEKRKYQSKMESSDLDMISKGKGIDGIINLHTEEIYNKLNETGRELLKDIFIRMVDLTGNRDDVIKAVNLDELIKDLKEYYSEDEIKESVNFLAGGNSGLLRIRKENNHTLIEIVHEVLLKKWERFRNWINEKREAVLFREEISRDASEFTNKKKKRELLYKGNKLKNAEKWIDENEDLNNDEIAEFIKSSRSRKRNKAILYIAVPLLMLILIFPILKFIKDWKFTNSALAKNFTSRNINLDEVRKLEITRESDFGLLYGFKNLDSLTVFIGQINEKPDMKEYFEIEELENISFLSIGYTINFENLDGIEKFRNLKSLTLTQFDNLQNLTGIENLTNLNSLTLNHLDNLQNLSGIEKLTNLNSLTVNQIDNLQNLSGIEKLINITSLNLKDLSGLRSLTGIENLTTLKYLVLDSLSFIQQPLSDIEKLTNLNSLTLIGSYNIQNLSRIEKLTNLNSLTLGSMSDLKDLTGIEKLTNLNSLSLIEMTGLHNPAGIEKLTNLNSLSLNDLYNFHDLTGIENLTNLNSLSLTNMDSLYNLKGIEKLTKLEYLKLDELNDFQSLTDIEKLTSLNSLTLIDLDSLQNLNGIEMLSNLKSLTLTDLGSLQNLKGIEKLDSLHVLCIVSDKLFKDIVNYNLTALQEIYVPQSGLRHSVTYLEILAEKFPNTKILYMPPEY